MSDEGYTGGEYCGNGGEAHQRRQGRGEDGAHQQQDRRGGQNPHSVRKGPDRFGLLGRVIQGNDDKLEFQAPFQLFLDLGEFQPCPGADPAALPQEQSGGAALPELGQQAIHQIGGLGPDHLRAKFARLLQPDPGLVGLLRGFPAQHLHMDGAPGPTLLAGQPEARMHQPQGSGIRTQGHQDGFGTAGQVWRHCRNPLAWESSHDVTAGPGLGWVHGPGVGLSGAA